MILDQDFQVRSYMYILVAQRLQIFRMSNLEVNKTLEARFQGTKATLKEF